MSTNMPTQCILPVELVCHILCYTSIRDVVRWRAVSKGFRDITHHPAIWKALYYDVSFMRPFRPFPSTSFESALVKSAQLAQSWTSKPLRRVSRVNIPFRGNLADTFRLIGGRWFIACQRGRRFVLYDTYANAETHVPLLLWEQEEEIVEWDEQSGVSEAGHCVVYLLAVTECPQRWTLLEFQVDADSGALRGTVSLDVPISNFHWFPSLHALWALYDLSQSRFISVEQLVFDKRTRTFYKFPKFRIAREHTMSGLASVDSDLSEIVVTNTHVLIFRLARPRTWARGPIVVQAFTVPEGAHPVGSGSNVLRLSHEGRYESAKEHIAVIRNSVVDPITGSVTVRLLDKGVGNGFDTTCTDFTLESSAAVVGPIIVKKRPVVKTGSMRTTGAANPCNTYYSVSDDGLVRGLFTLERCHTKRSGIVKFTIDAMQDYCTAFLGKFSPAEWRKVVCPTDSKKGTCHRHRWMGGTLDGMRGRLYYADEKRGRVVIVELE